MDCGTAVAKQARLSPRETAERGDAIFFCFTPCQNRNTPYILWLVRKRGRAWPGAPGDEAKDEEKNSYLESL